MIDAYTLDAVLENMYLPAMRDKIGQPNLRWSRRDGNIVIPEDDGYVALASLAHKSGTYILGRVVFDYRMIALSQVNVGAFVRYVRRQLDGLCDDYLEYMKMIRA